MVRLQWNLVFNVHRIASNMKIAYLIIWINIFIWLIPPVRQYKGKYFKFFLVLALIDPITWLSFKIFDINPNKVFVILVYILFISIFNSKEIQKNIILISLGLAAFISIPLLFSINICVLVLTLMHLIITGIFIKRFMIVMGKEFIVDNFLTALILYEITISAKMIFYFLKIPDSILLYYLTTGFEIFLALFFILFRSDNTRMKLKISFGNSA